MPNPKLPGPVSAITFQSGGVQAIAVFATVVKEEHRHLYMNIWDGMHGNIRDGTQWQWSDLGPLSAAFDDAGTVISDGPKAITFRDPESGQQLVNVFYFAAGPPHLYVNAFTGSQGQWSDLGPPDPSLEFLPTQEVLLNSPCGVISYEEPGILHPIQKMQVFFTGQDNQLYVNAWDGLNVLDRTHWRWSNLGRPASSNPFGALSPQVISGHSAITYLDPRTQVRKIAVFVKVRMDPFSPGADRLYINFWDGAAWNWTDIGPYQQSQQIGINAPDAISFQTTIGSAQVIRAYYFGEADGHLYMASSIGGANWSQQELDLPTGLDGGVIPVGGGPKVITFTTPGATTSEPEIRQVYAFTVGPPTPHTLPGGTHLLQTSIDLGTNPNSTWMWSPPEAITYQDPGSGQQLVFVFTVGLDDRLYMTDWNGTQWQWSDLGSPPF